MRVVYEWTQSEWNEAVRLAAERRRRGGSVSAITMGVILVPLIGGGITGLINLQHKETPGTTGTILLIALGLIALCLVLWMLGRTLRMRHLLAAAGPMPVGECEAVLQEGGWRFCALATATEETTPLQTVAATETPEGETVITTATATLTPWSSMTGARDGRRVVVFLHEEGFAGVPLRCLTDDQVGHVQRMMARKLRPVPPRR